MVALRTDFVDGDPDHTADGHNATNTRINELEATIDALQPAAAGTPYTVTATGNGTKRLHGPFAHNLGTDVLSMTEVHLTGTPTSPEGLSAAEQAIVDGLPDQPEPFFAKTLSDGINSCYVVIDTSVLPPATHPNGALLDGETAVLRISAGSGSQPAIVIDVSANGAVCDGTTNDTTAVQAVIDGSSEGDVIYFPGWCAVDATIELLEKRTYQAANHLTAGLKAVSAVASVAASERYLNGAATGVDEGIVLQEFGIDGNSLATDGVILRAFKSRVIEPHAFNCLGVGVRFESKSITDTAAASTAVDNKVLGGLIHDCDIGVANDEANVVSDGFIKGTVIHTVRRAVSLERSAGWSTEDVHAYNIEEDGLVYRNAFATSVSNCYVDNFGTSTENTDPVAGIFVQAQEGRPSHVTDNRVAASATGTKTTRGCHIRSELDDAVVISALNSVADCDVGQRFNVANPGTSLVVHRSANAYENCTTDEDVQANVTTP